VPLGHAVDQRGCRIAGPADGVAYCLSMIISENRRPLFWIMLWLAARGTGG
jgi:hypothetical protein